MPTRRLDAHDALSGAQHLPKREQTARDHVVLDAGGLELARLGVLAHARLVPAAVAVVLAQFLPVRLHLIHTRDFHVRVPDRAQRQAPGHPPRVRPKHLQLEAARAVVVAREHEHDLRRLARPLAVGDVKPRHGLLRVLREHGLGGGKVEPAVRRHAHVLRHRPAVGARPEGVRRVHAQVRPGHVEDVGRRLARAPGLRHQVLQARREHRVDVALGRHSRAHEAVEKGDDRVARALEPL